MPVLHLSEQWATFSLHQTGKHRITESLLLEHGRHFNLVWCNELNSYELRSFVNCGKIELLHIRAAILVQHYYYYYYFHLLIAVCIYAH